MSRPRHVPVRRCVACRDARPKRELIRLVRDGDAWRLDLTQRAGGRGTSLCPACALVAARVLGAAGATNLDAASGVRGFRHDDPDGAARLRGFRRAFRQEADAVAALLAPIASTLALATTPPDLGPASARDLTPPPNGGLHG